MDEEENKMEEAEVVEISDSTTNSVPAEKKGFNVTSLVLGIISIVCFCWWYVAIPTGIIAIIFSVAGRKEAGHGMGVAGLVLGIISLALWVVLMIVAMIAGTALLSGISMLE